MENQKNYLEQKISYGGVFEQGTYEQSSKII